MAIEKGVSQNVVRLDAAYVEMALEDDAILRERASLVGAQHIHGANVLNGAEALDDHLRPRHGDCASG